MSSSSDTPAENSPLHPSTVLTNQTGTVAGSPSTIHVATPNPAPEDKQRPATLLPFLFKLTKRVDAKESVRSHGTVLGVLAGGAAVAERARGNGRSIGRESVWQTAATLAGVLQVKSTRMTPWKLN